MGPLQTIRRRLVAQRLAGPPCADVPDAVRWLGASQAQEFAEAKWSLAQRTRNCSDADAEAAFARGDIIRTHVLRPTWHFVAREDLRWLLRLSRPRVHAINRHMYRQLELDGEVLSRAHEVLARTLADGHPRTRLELGECLAAAGIQGDGLRVGYVLSHAELEELVCSGPRRSKQQTFALFDHRVPTSALDDRSRESALDDLVLRYFRSRGPATIRDFTAWSSFPASDTKAALQRLGSELEQDEDGLSTTWAAARSSRRRSSARRVRALLIPLYDEMLIGYQDLRVVPPAEAPRGSGWLDRTILIDGRAVGSWRRTMTNHSVVVEATLLVPLDTSESEALDEAAERFGRFLGLPASVTATLATSQSMVARGPRAYRYTRRTRPSAG